MGFLFGLVTGIFAFVATLAIVVVHLLKINLDLADSQAKNIHNGTSQQSGTARANVQDFSDISETRLRKMIEKIIAETISISPPLTNGHAVSEISLDRNSRTIDSRPLGNHGYYPRHRTEHYFEPAIYQDLLATAVLNKIVDKQLNSKHDFPERDVGGADVIDNIGLASSDQNFNIEKTSTSSGSSVDPRSDCSYPEVETVLNNNDDKTSEFLANSDRDSVMSDYLANHMIPLPDLNAIATESEEDDYTSVTSSAIGDGTWEKNWLFKRKKSTLSASVTTSSIGMLVPDPKEDVRAQIGDKTADEVSDLSEIGSDSDDSLNSLRSQLEPINDRLINKHIIGGQNNKMILDELIERSSMISNDVESTYTDACNEQIINGKTKNEAINDNVNQQKSITEKQIQGSEAVVVCSAATEDLNSNSLTGSIAEREYKKWYNAVDMPNNPYAPEALKRRISGSQERYIDLPNIVSPTKDLNPLQLLTEQHPDADANVKLENDYKRYSRDYYINSSLTTSQTPPAKDGRDIFAKDNREVNNKNINKNNSYPSKNSLNATTKHSPNDCYWTLSAPVRRSSSLKYLNKSLNYPFPSHLHASSYHQHKRSSHILQTRPSTSTSCYNHFNNLNNDDTEDGEDNIVSHSQSSWRNSLPPISKRRTFSLLSLLSAESNRSSNTSPNNQNVDENALTQFEKQLLHKDLKRNSFRAVSATTKDFVLNPLYEKDKYFNGDKDAPKLSVVKPNQHLKRENDFGFHFRQDGNHLLF